MHSQQVTSSLCRLAPTCAAARRLHVLVRLVLVDAGPARRRLRLCFLLLGAHALLEDGFGLVDLELGLQVVGVAGKAAAVGAAAGVGKVEGLIIDRFVAGEAPVNSV